MDPSRGFPLDADISGHIGDIITTLFVSHLAFTWQKRYSTLFRVTMHHRREGHLLTQSQEEMVLIGGFGLFFMGEGLERLAFHLRLQRQYSLPVSSSYPFTKLRCWLGAVRKQEVSLQAPLERWGCLQPRGAADKILASRAERDRIPVRPTMFTV